MLNARILEKRADEFSRWQDHQAKKAQAICPEVLLHLNVSVFRQLRKLGTSKQRICAVLNLTADEYDYVTTIA